MSEKIIDMFKFTEVNLKHFDECENITVNFFGVHSLSPEIVSFLEKILNKFSEAKFIFLNTKLLVKNQLTIFERDNVRIFE